MDLFSLQPKLNELYMKKHEKNHSIFENYDVFTETVSVLKKIGLYQNSRLFHRSVTIPSVEEYGFFVTRKYLKELKKNDLDFYKINSEGFRCDEFTDKHDGLHVLFAGCSITFGDSTPEEMLWAKKVHNMISSTNKTSGYFNVGKPAASMTDVVNLIKEYSSRYSEPDVVFILFPDPHRDFFKGIEQAISLESEIKSKIIAFTWDKEFSKPTWSQNDPRNAIKYLEPIDESEFLKHLYKFQKEYDGDYKHFVLKALDDSHPGMGEQDFYAKIFYSRWTNA